jgi:hypothetical protein
MRDNAEPTITFPQRYFRELSAPKQKGRGQAPPYEIPGIPRCLYCGSAKLNVATMDFMPLRVVTEVPGTGPVGPRKGPVMVLFGTW